MSDTVHSSSEHSHTEPKRLSAGTYVITFVILLLILAYFAELFVFIVGTIGLVVTFAALYRDSADHGGHH